MSKRAIILAGGKGTRLRPYTIVLPKPLVPVGEYPILEIIIRQLAKEGFSRITIAVNHQAEIIKAFFSAGEKWGVKIDYSFEDKPLSTMGPLKLISELPDNFLVMNGDILTDLSFGTFYDEHVLSKNNFTIASYERVQCSDYGVLELAEDNKLRGFKEKPRVTYNVSMGIYMVNKKVLDYIPENIPYGFDNLMTEMIKQKDYPFVNRYKGYWLDIGRPDDYAQAIEEYEQTKGRFHIE